MVLRIKSLVFGEGLTLAGARRRLDETAGSNEPSGVLVEEVLGEHARERVRAVRDGLRGFCRCCRPPKPSRNWTAAPAAAKRAGKSKRRAG